MDRIRHKESNRFKFQSFAERISKINIDVFHRIPHRYEEDIEEDTTFFYQAIKKWSVLNLTENFKSFRNDIGYDINTLPQLINNKEMIVQVFLKHLKLQNELSLQPILETLVAFVKDIRYEFYPFLPYILKQLILLLKIKDPEILEVTFTCLAYIFKYLSRKLVKDIDEILMNLAPLLNSANPDYIRDFAAQSFAFVARKTKDNEKFLMSVLQTVHNHPYLLEGISQLIFHMLCGINRQSHSVAVDLLRTLFNLFFNPLLPQKLLFLMTKNIINSYGNAIAPQHSILFVVLLNVLKENTMKNTDPKSIKYLLKVMKMGLECKSGEHLKEDLIPQLTNVIIELLPKGGKIQKISSEICGSLLILNKLKISEELASLLISKVLNVKETEILLNFIDQIIDYSKFETLVLPQALKIFCNFHNKIFLQNLAKIIIHKLKLQMKNYNNLATPVYIISLNNSSFMLKDTILDIIEKFDPRAELTNDILYALIIIRHISPNDHVKVQKLLLQVIYKILKFNGDSIVEKENHLLLLGITFESLLYFKNVLQYEFVDNSVIFGALQFLSKTESILTLRIVNLILTIVKDFDISEGLRREIFCNIEKFIQWPHSNARFLALHSLQCLEKFKINGNEESKKNMSEILQICLDIEIIPLTISDYREKIKELQKLKYSSLISLNDEEYQVVIRYLLGILFCNFQLLWDPVSEVLSTYACNIPVIFWNIFYNHLCFVTEICKNGKHSNDLNFHAIEDFVTQGVRFITLEDKADYSNYRFLMWKSMALFSDLCETKNRDIIYLYLAFLQEEFLESSSQYNSTINIKQNEDEDMDVDEEETVPLSSQNSNTKKTSSSTIKWAIAHLNLLSKFKNPRHCYKETEVRNSYYDLLQHKNIEIQKLALECLFTYKFKYMIPYKQNLKNLVDDVKFKDEIVYFQIDKENGVIKQNHRDDLMPIVMRILHNKMLSRSAVKRGSKGSAALSKRSIVFRFLAGCSDSEMEIFFQMAFMAFQSHQKANFDVFVQIMNSVDLESVTPPKKLQNVVNLADAIVEHFGGLMSVKLQRYILKILFSVGATIVGIFSQREKVFSGYMTSLKNTRNANTDCLAKFFDRLSFPWNEDEINTVFEIFIWPNLEKLSIEGIYNPTATLRIFSTWSENPRYHILFARYKINDESITPLPFIIKLLLNEKSQASVTSCIISIIEKLLTMKEEITDENINDVPLELDNILQVDEQLIKKLSLKEELNYGSQILIPHVGSILTYLRKKLEKSNNNLQKAELTVLSRITELATSPENADSLMMITIRLLIVNKPNDDEILMNTIITVENLTKVVNKPISYLKSLATLLNSLEAFETRKILINSLLNIQNRCSELKESVNIIKDLNAFDEKWIQQPDFEKRVSTYKKINDLALENKIDINFAIMVLYNSFYVIRCDVDSSMRDISSYCLKKICPLLANNWKENKFQNQFWIDSILKLIHGGIVGKNENLYSFSVSLLGVMARECGSLHAVLEDLAVYSNKEDLEVDLFENTIHLQIHRRLRALLRFCSLSKTLIKAPKTRTLVQFILPLATRFLFNEKYATKNSLIDSAIQCIGVVCKFLPWNKYQALLRYYLSKFHGNIEYQRQLVRVIIAILDSFHFDISNSNHSKFDFKIETSDNQNSIPSDEKMEVEEEMEQEEVVNEYKKKESELLEELQNDENFEIQERENGQEMNKVEDISENIILPYESLTVLDSAEATRVERAMSGPLLTQLFKAIGQRTQVEDTHKSNYKNLGPNRDQEEVQRIPIAVTLIKLLQKISKKMLESHLPGILMKLCTFLKSKLESVRRVTRETMQEIIVSLGPQYLHVIFSEITSALTKGFQLHVLIFTMHAIIQAVQDQLQRGDIDKNLPILLHVCKTDIFGQPAEEKTIKQIQAKHKEVRSTKSYRLMNLIAQNITEKCLTDLLMPIKNILLTSYSRKAIAKSRECLRHVVLGLCANEFITIDNLFIFIYGITSESIPKLFIKEKVQEEKKNPKEKNDCFIIPKEPKNRVGTLSNPVKQNTKSNDNILIEFGFQLMQFLLKKEKLKTIPNFKSYLDSLGPILIKAVESRHVKASSLALNCLCKIFKYDLPKVKKLLDVVINELFIILYKYAVPGLSKGETFELVLVTYKAICVIMKDTNYEGIDADKLKILVIYVEQDIYNNHRQASAFNLLKSILKRKLNIPELFELLKKVAELSITSELSHVRLQARQAVFRYVMDYPFGKEVEYFIKFYISQLSFELESGRQSALEMIHGFITSFPQKVLNEQCGLFLVTLGARLINDDSPECRKGLSGVMKSMLMRLDKTNRDQLFNICTIWLKQKKLNHKRLAAQLIGIFVTIEKSDFMKRLPGLLPLIQSQFTNDCSKLKQFVHVTNKENQEKTKDYHLFQVMQLLLKICSHCPNFLIHKENQESVHFFVEMSHSLLSHPHEWVRLSAMQFLGCLLNSINPVEISSVLNGKRIISDLAFLESTSLHSRIKSLILDHVAQFVPGIEVAKESIEQAAKNLVFFARVLKDLKETESELSETEMCVNDNGNNFKVASKKISMLWLIRKMRGIVNKEIAETPHSYHMRTGVLKWIGAVAICFSSEELCKILYHLIAPVVREIDVLEGRKSDNAFKSLVMEVAKVLKKKVGVEKFTNEAVKIRKRLLERRIERRTQRAREFVTNPEKAAKRKIEKQAKKKLIKKKKIEVFKGKSLKKFKSKKKTENDLFA